MDTRMKKRESERLERTSERPTTPPRADIYENKDEYLVIADVPGVDKNSLTLNLDNDRLTLSARIGAEREESVLSREYRPVDYYRSFVIPEDIDREKVSADLSQGVLHLHLPKSEAGKPRRIEVKAD